MVNFYDEEFSYPAIIERMLENVPVDIDKREGSVIYNALAPAAAELSQMYIWLQQVLILGFADTSSGDFLTLRAKELGVIRGQATSAVYEVLIELEDDSETVPLNSQFVVDDYTFTLIEPDKVRISVTGESGNNVQAGTELLPVNNVNGLKKISIQRVIERGIDEESDTALRNRYYLKSRQEAYSGNASHYKLWAEQIDGVGLAKIFPLYDGPGTVKVVIVNANYQPPLQSLVSQVQNTLDPIPGIGQGAAPIGARVSVVGAENLAINIRASVDLVVGRTQQEAVYEMTNLINNYLSQNSFRLNELRISNLQDLFLRAETISDFTDIRINDVGQNFSIPEDVVLTLNNLSLEAEGW